jgi:RNA polymerase sigma-70 factor, ECF subfamily
VFAAQAIHPADAVLVRCARDGDRASFGRLYERYRPMVHGILLAYVPYGEAEDLMQEAFVRAMEGLPKLRDDAAFGPWLASIARHLALDHLRRRRPFVEADESNGGSSRQDESAMVLDAIRRLPEAYRETLLLRLVEGMTGPEIALRTGLRPDSVRVNLCRGMKMLREQLGSASHA